MEDLNMATPPPELRAKWRSEAPRNRDAGISREDYLMDRAAEWSADQELEACVEWIEKHMPTGYFHTRDLRAARRPKPPSLKEQALADFNWLVGRALVGPGFDERSNRIRRALEALPND